MAISDRFSNRPGTQEINSRINQGSSQGYQLGRYNTGSGSPYVNKPNNTSIAQYYQQMNALQNKPQNYFQQAMTDVNATGVFNPIMQNIKEQMGWAHPYGSSIGDQQLAQQVAATMAQYVSPYAQMLGNQAFQRNQNLINQAAGLYGQQQGLNQQGAIAAGNQWLQAQQLGQQANQWQQQFDRQQDWYNDAQRAQQNRPSGGGTAFYGSTPWGNAGGGGVGGATGSGSGLNRPQMDWDADGNLVPVGTGGSSGGNGGGYTYSGGGWMSNYPSWSTGGGGGGGIGFGAEWSPTAAVSAGQYY